MTETDWPQRLGVDIGFKDKWRGRSQRMWGAFGFKEGIEALVPGVRVKHRVDSEQGETTY